MKYGLIGEHLPHSFSKEIHERLGYEYKLAELSPDELDGFMKKRDFAAINVTIPYKSAVIPYLAEMNEGARQIGAVNTVINRGGKLYGYNTDHFGMCALIDKLGLELCQKKVLILGTGGTSNTAAAVAEHFKASDIIKVGRSAKDGSITYGEAYRDHSDADIIINTTPCGMFPFPDGEARKKVASASGENAAEAEQLSGVPIDISRFPRLCGVVDAVYNPIRTNLVLDAAQRGIAAEGGLYMLVMQAARASEIFTGKAIPSDMRDGIFHEILAQKQNIVLTGMPGSGKSTVGRALAEKLKRAFVDTDTEIVKRTGKTIADIFRDDGEARFRDIEQSIIEEVCAKTVGAVIATGGGAILRDRNVRLLSRNGRIYFLNRAFDKLTPTKDRPIASNAEMLRQRYEERYERYLSTCDKEIKVNENVSDTVTTIMQDFFADEAQT